MPHSTLEREKIEKNLDFLAENKHLIRPAIQPVIDSIAGYWKASKTITLKQAETIERIAYAIQCQTKRNRQRKLSNRATWRTLTKI
jgi:hypothetical protein